MMKEHVESNTKSNLEKCKRNKECFFRNKKKIKSSNPNKPLITIVTVCLNAENNIKKTIKSVIEQSYDNIEYIIIDGGSTDNTLSIIKRNEHNVDYWISETDKGIYDAMNKAIEVANGEWINFMNAGDQFFDKKTCETFVKKSFNTTSHIIYGNYSVNYNNNLYINKKAFSKLTIYKLPTTHQSFFVKRSLYEKQKYNTKFDIGADFDFYLRCIKNQYTFRHIDLTISVILSGGISDDSRVKTLNEYCIISNLYFPHYYNTLFYKLLLTKETIKKFAKKILGDKIFIKYIKFKNAIFFQ
jgi:glycosyltransferase involved in cell wall biosynthesis